MNVRRIQYTLVKSTYHGKCNDLLVKYVHFQVFILKLKDLVHIGCKDRCYVLSICSLKFAILLHGLIKMFYKIHTGTRRSTLYEREINCPGTLRWKYLQQVIHIRRGDNCFRMLISELFQIYSTETSE